MYSHSYRNLASYNTVFNQMFYLSTLTLEFIEQVCMFEYNNVCANYNTKTKS